MKRSCLLPRGSRSALVYSFIVIAAAFAFPAESQTAVPPSTAQRLEFSPPSAQPSFYVQQNLVSDLTNPPGGAPSSLVVDPNLINPWGVAFSSTGPFWVTNQGTATATIYSVNGSTGALTKASLVVNIPGSTPGPTAEVFNSTSSFLLANGNPALFLFAALNGTISGWNGGAATQIVATGAPTPASYTGLAIANRGSGPFLYAANSAGGRIDVFDQKFNQATLPGSFTDPNLPPGDVPFNVVNINQQLFVTYEGPFGVVNIFDTDGNFIKRFASGGTILNPWGLVLAPANFGKFSNSLLIGNFNHSFIGPNGFGWISAFDPVNGKFLGVLEQQLPDQNTSSGQTNWNDKAPTESFPILIDGLWSLSFGNGASGGQSNVLYFSAGIGATPGGYTPPPMNGTTLETHGLFGSISLQPPPQQQH